MHCALYKYSSCGSEISSPFKADRVENDPSLVSREEKKIFFQIFVIFCFLCTVNRIYVLLNMFFLKGALFRGKGGPPVLE